MQKLCAFRFDKLCGVPEIDTSSGANPQHSEREENNMQDQYGTHFETTDGKAPSSYGQNISIHTPAGLVPGQWLGSNGAHKL
jgi:hypothetical protein